tara:strand:+ start:2152 stop:2730 length:579 start_codon:yes stop_codon:yes gene_type:complete
MSTTDTKPADQTADQEGWKELISEISSNFKEQWYDPRFVIYFFIFIVLIGGFGIWIEAINIPDQEAGKYKGLKTALITFSLALSAATIADLFLHEPDRTLVKQIGKTLRFACLTLGLLLVITNSILLFSGDSLGHIILSCLTVFSTLLLWWNINSYNPTLNSNLVSFDPNATLGDTEKVSNSSAKSNKIYKF